jgi:hypothetical protein
MCSRCGLCRHSPPSKIVIVVVLTLLVCVCVLCGVCVVWCVCYSANIYLCRSNTRTAHVASCSRSLGRWDRC